MNKIEAHIAEFCSNHQLARYFVACSGGVDSMVLLHILHKLGKTVSAVHVNYMLRSEDSEKDQEIFRDIIINEEDNFESFYRAILNSFNFEGKEMGSFFMSNDEWDKGHEISLMDMSYSDEDMEITSVMSEAKLTNFMEAPDQKIILVYDFLSRVHTNHCIFGKLYR